MFLHEPNRVVETSHYLAEGFQYLVHYLVEDFQYLVHYLVETFQYLVHLHYLLRWIFLFFYLLLVHYIVRTFFFFCEDFSLFSFIFFFLISFHRAHKNHKNSNKRISYLFPLRCFLSDF